MNEESKKLIDESIALVADKAAVLLAKRAERIAGRKFFLFPWLRYKWIMRKLAKLKSFSAKSCCCSCHA